MDKDIVEEIDGKKLYRIVLPLEFLALSESKPNEIDIERWINHELHSGDYEDAEVTEVKTQKDVDLEKTPLNYGIYGTESSKEVTLDDYFQYLVEEGEKDPKEEAAIKLLKKRGYKITK